MTAAQYIDYLQDIERENPSEPLLSVLRRGYSAVNAVYMRVAWNRIPETVAELPRETNGTAPAGLKYLWGKRSRLFAEMNRESNRFHDCSTDSQRAVVSNRILSIWSEIKDVKSKIQYWEENGEAPDQAIGADLPQNPAALVMRLNSLRSNRTQTQAALRQLAQQGADPKKIEKQERRLLEINRLIQLAETQIKEEKNAS